MIIYGTLTSQRPLIAPSIGKW